MNASDARLMELALRKQRLQFDSEHLRARCVRGASVIPPLCAGADRIVDGWYWLRARPAIPVAIGVALLVSRPRRVWRWLTRGVAAWQAWRRVRGLLDSALQAQR